MTETRHSTYLDSADSTLPYFEDSPSRRDLDGTRRNSNLPLFDLRTIIAATDNFSIANKLGQGGFDLVYKGLLQNGMIIAVKRLSKCSGQGMEQFKTEVALIAKLQHRNLVRILGCCIHKKEKMLIYEYLPNKSLDSCIFEIITGKKNSTYHHDGPSSNLIGHVWDIWREENSLKMVDPLLDETYPANEFSRCIQIGLLCVQEHAIDRPTMSTVVFMLGNGTHLPSPKQPAFILKGNYTITNRSTSSASNSVNEITLSTIDGR
ncbi:G-type lectin S-receptor-like serine/threonine-protein kinase RKS1 [Quercus suber]|uniref:G-type lectin S-receptor-like serine/threonine-protein kinase RKS1 n=1 Tax=Quercus suber TaxID=58331 RepID=UPI0032DF92F6